MGTGAYLHGIIDHAAKRAEELDGPGAVGHAITDLAQRLIGFELKMGSYTVAEMRAVDILKSYGAELPKGGVRLHVTNTLDDPFIAEAAVFPGLDALAKSHMQANKIKANTPVTVVIGNPPYRDKAGGEGGWVEQGSTNTESHAPLDRFRKKGNGRLEFVLKNLYIYFWAWAAWKVFDAHQQDRHGVISFITPFSYLKGPGFKGMREYLRRTCSEGWIINVSPEGMRSDIPTRFFPGVQQPLAIAIFVRRADASDTTPADIQYTHVTGSSEEKYDQLDNLTLDHHSWRPVRTDWGSPLLPTAESAWDDHPALSDLFSWMSPGIDPCRTWVYAPHPQLLTQRWIALLSEENLDQKKTLFKETRDRCITSKKKPLPGTEPRKSSIEKEAGKCPTPKRIAYRSFDRQ